MLPSWQGAEEVYSRAYLLLEKMRKSGHSTAPVFRRGKRIVIIPGTVSEEMQALIEALNSGEEERIKALLLLLLMKEASK